MKSNIKAPNVIESPILIRPGLFRPHLSRYFLISFLQDTSWIVITLISKVRSMLMLKSTIFLMLGIDRFTECKELIYPNIVREFYTNLHVGENEGSTYLVLHSLVGGTCVKISLRILHELFGLSYDGFMCSKKLIEDEESGLTELEVNKFLISKVVIEITDDVFENKNFGIQIHLSPFKVFSDILLPEHIMDCYYFNFGSLDRANVEIYKKFLMLGIDHFTECKELIYPNIVREFYANLHVGENEHSTSLVLQSLVGGTCVKISSRLLHELFGLFYDGFMCSEKLIEDEESGLNELEVNEFLISKAVIEITDDVFENNNFGIQIHLLLVALTKCLMPKVKTEHKLVGIDKLVASRVLNDDKVNFAAIVLSWTKAKGDIFIPKHYTSWSRRIGMPLGLILTVIFRHHNMNLSEEVVVLVSRGHEISDSMLKVMHYVEAINQGWVLVMYLKEDDEVPKETRMPTQLSVSHEEGQKL
ncbi:hypothetical protein OROMI_012727 [Orobanche minor]